MFSGIRRGKLSDKKNNGSILKPKNTDLSKNSADLTKNMTILNKLINQIQIPQKVYNPPKWEKPDLDQYPVDYLYLDRLGYNLGEPFRDMKLVDIKNPTIFNAIKFSIIGKQLNDDDDVNINFNNYDYVQDFCRKLSINVLIIGPDPNNYKTILRNNNEEIKDYNTEPWVFLYHTMEDFYYPIITLERREHYIFYRQSNSTLQKLWLESP
tara:strand:- start:1637 stop:2266 length:630 start_codon:yes stop_codon:yes gene_type:complete